MNQIIRMETHRMSKRRGKHKPSEPRHIPDPAESARRGVPPENWGVNDEALKLKANADVDSTLDHRGRVQRAMRWDVFEMFRVRGLLPQQHYDAVRRLQDDIAVLHQAAGDRGWMAGRATPDALQAWLRDITADFSISRLLAAKRLYGTPSGAPGVLQLLRPWAAQLLLALCIPEVVKGDRVNWHATVTRILGEHDRAERAKRVREIAAALAAAYSQIDNQPKQAA